MTPAHRMPTGPLRARAPLNPVRLGLLLLLLACPAGAKEYATSTPDVRILFNEPPTDGGAEAALLPLLSGAKQEIAAALYQIGREPVVDALVAAAKRLGPHKVRVISDRKYATDSRKYAADYARLAEAGIIVEYDGKRGDAGQGLMHNKFIVIDGETVWTGSMNLTDDNMAEDANNVVILRSPKLAAIYLQEFREMYEDGRFGARKADDTAKEVRIGDYPVEVYFSPTDDVNRVIVDVIDGARRTLDFAIYTFTSEEIARAMARAGARGVRVRGVFDNLGVGSPACAWRSLEGRPGVEIRSDGETKRRHALIHHKFLVVDAGGTGAVTLTGSHNFTKGADRKNDENTLILRDPLASRAFAEEFEKLWRLCGDEPPPDAAPPAAAAGGPSATAPPRPAPQTRPASSAAAPRPAGPSGVPAAKPAAAPPGKIAPVADKPDAKPVTAPPGGSAPAMVKAALRDVLTPLSLEVDAAFAAFRKTKAERDALGILSFGRREALLREETNRYVRYNALRKSYNRLVVLEQRAATVDDIAKEAERARAEAESLDLAARKAKLDTAGGPTPDADTERDAAKHYFETVDALRFNLLHPKR